MNQKMGNNLQDYVLNGPSVRVYLPFLRQHFCTHDDMTMVYKARGKIKYLQVYVALYIPP